MAIEFKRFMHSIKKIDTLRDYVTFFIRIGGNKMDEKVIIAWNCIKSLDYYPIICSTNEEQDEFEKIPFNELFKDQIKIIDNHIDLTNEIINKASDDIQKVIDLLDSKIVTMGHLNGAIKKLEVIQDELMGVKEDG